MEKDISDDNRFSVIYTDPRFKKVPKFERKVKIDKRFRSMFTDNRFKVKYAVDKRGRPFCRSTTEDYKKFYDLTSDEDSDDKSINTDSKDDSDNSLNDSNHGNVSFDSQNRELDNRLQSSEDEGTSTGEQELHGVDNRDRSNKVVCNKTKRNVIGDEIKEKLRNICIDYARGEQNLFSESSSDEPESEESDSGEVEHKWGEFDNDAERTENITSRLAVCNMDWDRIRAEDMMMLFNSFLPPSGVIRSLTIYPSEYGLKRIKEEEINGPTELVNGDEQLEDDASDSNAEEADEGKAYRRESLRQYQLNRLKYYYAVIEFDSAETADKIYKECDNLEYESSSTRLDLRFIPDDVIFDQEPKERCDRLPDLSKYKPRYFTTTALQQAKVELTWDETDPSREEFAQKISEAVKSGDIDDADISNYVALSTSEDEDEADDKDATVEKVDAESEKNNGSEDIDKQDPILAYRNLLKEIEEKEQNKDDVQLEISWGPGSEMQPQRKQGSSRNEENGRKTESTPFQKLVEKDKEKRRQRKKLKKLKKKNTVTNREDGSSDEIHFESEDEIVVNDGHNVSPKVDDDPDISDDSDEANSTDDAMKKQGELELLLMDDDNNKKSHFSLKKIKEKEAKRSRRKRKEKLKKNIVHEDDENIEVDVHDKRFEAVYYSHLFNIDPADPHFHKTKGMEAFITEKQKRKAGRSNGNNKSTAAFDNLLEEPVVKTSKKAKSGAEMGDDLSLLVKSVKKKTVLLTARNKTTN